MAFDKLVVRRGYDRAKVIFVDDSPSKLRRSYGNLVAVRAFEGQPDDRELALLLPYLRSLGPVSNVRTIEKRGWRSRSLLPIDGEADGSGPALDE